MRVRLQYVVILVISALAVVVGLYPSLLSLGALVGLATGTIALVGVAKPSLVQSRTGVRRLATGGAVFLALELVAFATWLALTSKRTVYLEVATAHPAIVRVVYGVRDGVSSPWWRWNRDLIVQGSGLVYSSLDRDNGWYRSGRRHPVEAQDSRGVKVPVQWTAGGYTHAGRCELAYDEFTLGIEHAKSQVPANPGSGWLDSLSAWGVQCRNGLLFRGPIGSVLQRTGPTCYYDREGGVTCTSFPRAP